MKGIIPRGRPQPAKPIVVYYELDRRFQKYRWWQTNWPQDMFDFVKKEDMHIMVEACRKLGVTAIDHLPSQWCECGCAEYA